MEKSTMGGIPYNGYLILPTPLPLAGGEWGMEVNISKDGSSNVKSRKFRTGERFKTEAEAIKHCIHYAKKIIDGKVEKLSVADL